MESSSTSSVSSSTSGANSKFAIIIWCELSFFRSSSVSSSTSHRLQSSSVLPLQSSPGPEFLNIQGPKEAEIKEAVFSLKKCSSLDPNGFTCAFFCATWHIIVNSIVHSV
ncbi:hypothetical protein MRB53_005603 [Persea americana]|uniref:Uncharacterized protein n=1 Tax=Persea americana TaxID=3435 RepID=A0ACC2MDS7_PERAE|nr:hypothetical protein MRB53_005603 [Persea americana]